MSCCRKSATHIATELHRRGLTTEAATMQKIEADKWKTLPKGWTEKSVKKFWSSLTGDRKHKITQCIKKMSGKVDDPGAFCGGLASRVGYR